MTDDKGRRPDSDDPMVVVPKGPNGERIKSGGWTEAVTNENYTALVEAWRKQDPKAGSTTFQTKP
jgi:hypothetical protein